MCPGLEDQEEKCPFEKFTRRWTGKSEEGERGGEQRSGLREPRGGAWGFRVPGFQAGGCVKSLDPKSQGWARGQIEIGRDLALLRGCAWAP